MPGLPQLPPHPATPGDPPPPLLAPSAHDEEIINEMVSVLGFRRRGVRIDEAIKNALDVYRATSQ